MCLPIGDDCEAIECSATAIASVTSNCSGTFSATLNGTVLARQVFATPPLAGSTPFCDSFKLACGQSGLLDIVYQDGAGAIQGTRFLVACSACINAGSGKGGGVE